MIREKGGEDSCGHKLEVVGIHWCTLVHIGANWFTLVHIGAHWYTLVQKLHREF